MRHRIPKVQAHGKAKNAPDVEKVTEVEKQTADRLFRRTVSLPMGYRSTDHTEHFPPTHECVYMCVCV
jgi:hypothetical protein